MDIQGITSFCTEQLQAKSTIMGPWLRTGELCLLYAETGAGKSYFGMCLAHAVATGQPFLKWRGDRAFKTCYVEAEMSRHTCQTRLSTIDDSSGVAADPANFCIVTRDKNRNHLPNLSVAKDQKELYEIFEHFELIVIDNLTTIAPPVDSRDSDVSIWYRIKPFLIQLRNEGKTVLIVHHSGKSGDQLGTSLRCNDMDMVIKIQQPGQVLNDKALSLELHFQKPRDVPRSELMPLFCEMFLDDGIVRWDYHPLREVRQTLIQNVSFRIKSRSKLAEIFKCSPLEVEEALAHEPYEEKFRRDGQEPWDIEDDRADPLF